MFEEMIAYHCAPALAGIKPANLVSCDKKRFGCIAQRAKHLNAEMNARGIHFEIMCECGERTLMMVYREKELERYLKRKEISAFLRTVGYPKEFSIASYLEHLKERLKGDAFPHEIGAFLGYPLRDIRGFINKEKCIFVGDWKVYGDAERARELFGRYSACRRSLVRHVAAGNTLAQLVGGYCSGDLACAQC